MNESTLKIKRDISKDEFSKAIETISDVYEQFKEQLQSLRNQCDDLQAKLNDQYANDKEIVRLQEIIDEQNSELQYGFGITKEENEIITEWIKKHNLKKHGSEIVYYGAIGGGMTYIFVPTSIGTVGSCRCDICHQRAMTAACAHGSYDRNVYQAEMKERGGTFDFQTLD